MNTQLIRQRLNQDTRPFVLRLSDGTSVRVAHPDFVAVVPGLIHVLDTDYSVTKVDPLHVVTIEEPRPRKAQIQS
ncbi:MAG TPA: hypothetical protein VN578_23775 [Candidatus Binatia bacterium]|jgi:hypothetical protein|nr:hypothetical protein [Candidatus Binatia bacterium]